MDDDPAAGLVDTVLAGAVEDHRRHAVEVILREAAKKLAVAPIGTPPADCGPRREGDRPWAVRWSYESIRS
jgi:hypothetical protein